MGHWIAPPPLRTNPWGEAARGDEGRGASAGATPAEVRGRARRRRDGTGAGASRGDARVMAPGDWLELLVRLGVGGECIVSQAHGSELMESGVRSGEGKP